MSKPTEQYVHLRLKGDFPRQTGLPDIGYPVPVARQDHVVAVLQEQAEDVALSAYRGIGSAWRQVAPRE